MAAEYGGALERLARAYERDADKRRDLLQEIHVALWRSLARFDGRVSPNVALFAGNTSLRIAAVGWDDVPSDAAATARQAAMLEAALDAGALGLSTGLDYPPGGYASTDELVALARVVARVGGVYHTHVRYALGDGYLDPFREAIDICRRAELPLHVTHFSRSSRGPSTIRS